MRRKLKDTTKDRVISLRISDEEMEHVRQLMEVTNLSASELMRKAFHLQVHRLTRMAAMGSSGL